MPNRHCAEVLKDFRAVAGNRNVPSARCLVVHIRVLTIVTLLAGVVTVADVMTVGGVATVGIVIVSTESERERHLLAQE